MGGLLCKCPPYISEFHPQDGDHRRKIPRFHGAEAFNESKIGDLLHKTAKRKGIRVSGKVGRYSVQFAPQERDGFEMALLNSSLPTLWDQQARSHILARHTVDSSIIELLWKVFHWYP